MGHAAITDTTQAQSSLKGAGHLKLLHPHFHILKCNKIRSVLVNHFVFPFQYLSRREALPLTVYLKTNTSFSCYVIQNGQEIDVLYKRSVSFIKAFNGVFWPTIVLFGSLLMTVSASYQKYMSTRRVRQRHNLSQFISYAEKGDVQNLVKCLDNFVESPLKNQGGWTYRFKAVVNIDDEDKNLGLCALGAAVYIKENQTMTDSRIKCVEMLLAHGANVQYCLPRRLAFIVTEIFINRPVQKLYAMTIIKKLLAAGYQMAHQEQQDILTHLLKKYWEGTSIQVKFFIESLDMSIFTADVIKQSVRNLLHNHDNISDSNTNHLEDRRQVLGSILERYSGVPSLQVSCRIFIPRHLLCIHCDKNLYFLIKQLPLPSPITRFLLLSCYTLPSHTHYGTA